MLNDATGFSHIYLCTGYTDLRNGIDGLIAVVNGTFGLDPTAEGSIFLYVFRKNIGAISLYKGFGFEAVKTVSDTRQIMERPG